MTETKAAPDWERIELDYRAGIKTLRQIASEHSLTHGAVNKRAKRDGWERDLAAKIKQKADALVSRASVSETVSKESKAAEREVVEANALAVADVRLSHRRDITKTRSIAMRLLKELDQQVEQADTRAPDEAVSDPKPAPLNLQGKAKILKDLGESLRVLVALERQAYGIGEEVPPPLGHETLTDDELDRAIAKLAKQV